MSKKTLIDSVRVASPCTEDWEQMQGNEQARFCTHCSKNVRDLSAITRKRAMRLVQDSGSNICIRYIPDPSTGQPLFSEQLVRLTRHRPRLLAGVMSASLSLSTFAHAQESPVPATPESEQQIVADQTPVTGSNDQEEVEESETPKQDPDKSIIEGFVVDETGKVVQDVHLMITNTEDDENDYETTDERGYFKFVDIEPGNYLIRVYGINGLRKAMPPVTVNAGQTLNQYLHVTREKDTESEETTYFGSGMGGAMAVIPYKLPLTQAVAEGDLDKARILIASGSDVNEGDENYDGITALFIAVENGNLDMIRLLLEHHADVNAKNTAEMTPLMFLDEDASTQVLQMLLNAGADTNAAAKDGSSILSNIINSASEDVVEMAIRAGAPVDKPNQAGETPLMKVAERGKPELVRILLEAGADARASDGSGQTAWDRATNAKIEEMLVAYGASADYGNIVVANRSTKDDDH